jgi:predicted amidohydrolase
MTDSIIVAILQREIVPHDPPGNLMGALEMLGRVSSQGVDLFVLTELWTTGLLSIEDGSAADLVEGIEGPTIDALRDFCRGAGTCLLAGTIALREMGRTTNTSLLIDQSGEIALKYSKIQLFGPFEEDKVFCPGDTLAVAEVKGTKVGVLVCYDLRFPLLARKLARAGCEILLVPALWPDERIEHWEILLRARAIENQIFVVGANGVMNQDGIFFPGHSLIVGPDGNALNSPEMRETAIVRQLNLEDVRESRERTFYLEDEREVRGPG